MSGAFFAFGEPQEVAARLPVALLSLAFLALAAWLVAREFGTEASALSISLLATCAGWVAYSNFCLTDLPMAVFFSLAVLLALPLLRETADTSGILLRFLGMGSCLGLAALAKGLVPLALALPLAWFLRRWWRAWGWAAFACALVAGPWYVAIYLRQGMPFVREFFFKHHFERMYSNALQHGQPWYYYVPVLFGALFPWTPLFLLFARRGVRRDRRRSLLLATVLFGFLFFSVIVNKLPGYLLPLLPLLFVLLGAEFEGCSFAEVGRKWLIPSALLIAFIPLIAQGLPDALAAGNITAFHFGRVRATECFYIAAPLAALLSGKRSRLIALLVLCVVAAGILLKTTAYPILDERVSARGLWRQLQRDHVTVCDGGINRAWAYGLSFYRESELPDCGKGQFYDRVLRSRGRDRPAVEVP
jgi:4-amino-4-deoxy-L-arabinose transferase-like glycosyltransferase